MQHHHQCEAKTFGNHFELGESQIAFVQLSINNALLDELIHDANVGVRIYSAKIHWRKNRRAQAIVPVLIESLDRSKHQSYYYAETQPVALAVLSEIGPEAHEAIGTLEKLFSDPNPAIVKMATEAVAKIRAQ